MLTPSLRHDPLEELLTAWRQRAEAIRSASPAAPASFARADTLDACAAQLAQLLGSLLPSSTGGRDPKTLDLFTDREAE